MFKAFLFFAYLKTIAIARIQLRTETTSPTILRIFSVLQSSPDSFWYEKAKTNPMIPKIRPTIGDSKPRTIDKIPKISEGFFFCCEFIL